MSESGWKLLVLGRIGSQMKYLAESAPRVYLLLASLFAIAGYAYLLLFPWLVLVSGLGIYDALFNSQAVIWSHALIWLIIATLSGLVTCRGIQIKPVLPAGLELEKPKTTGIFHMLEELSRHYRQPAIDRIVITGDYELQIVKSPLWALPMGSTNTLVIGLPLMQSLSPVQFRCAVARRLGQFSKRYNLTGNWLTQLRDIWPQYCVRAEFAGFGYQPIQWFFSIYAPLYDVITVSAARIDELAADRYAMELFSDEELLETITTEAVCRLYLEEKYWPVIRKITSQDPETITKPRTAMASVLRAGLQADKALEWLVKAVAVETQWDDPVPSLARRIENIGHTQARMNTLAEKSAATVYLGKVICDLDSMRAPGVSQGRKMYQRKFQATRPPPYVIRPFKRKHKEPPVPATHANIPSV